MSIGACVPAPCPLRPNGDVDRHSGAAACRRTTPPRQLPYRRYPMDAQQSKRHVLVTGGTGSVGRALFALPLVPYERARCFVPRFHRSNRDNPTEHAEGGFAAHLHTSSLPRTACMCPLIGSLAGRVSLVSRASDLCSVVSDLIQRIDSVYPGTTTSAAASSRTNSSTSWIVLAGTALILTTTDLAGLSIRMRSTHCRRAQSFSCGRP